ncbi:hypothetical protein BHM03_00031091 [Ensete ventricosum]|nr:hypothetical protein BHM03_00031091 [Ensete ventricosum]
MSQECPSNLFLSQTVEEAIPPTLTAATTPLAPQVGPMDMGQPMLTPDRYWRLLNDPGLTYPVLYPSPQAVSAEAFLGLSHEVQALTGMIQAIIPHIPQLTQTMAPPQSEPQ